jgi:DNA excision repair protein ERCC-2
MPEFGVTVLDLARFCHHSGDIDHRFTPSPTGEQGTEGHQRVFRRRPGTYVSEVPVELHRKVGDIEIMLRGRADGYDSQEAYVEEIKTCRVAARSIPESVSRGHLTQGRLYAALIAIAQGLDELEVRLTWFNIDSGREDTLSQSYSRQELDEFLDLSVRRYAAWLEIIAQRRERRDRSLTGLDFPLGDFRVGQRDIAELVYKCIDQAGELMVEAPTGLGKTAAVFYPALKALATGKHDGIVYVTAKTVGRRAAEETLGHFTRAGMFAPALSLTAKEQICFEPGRACHGDDCPFARGYYDRLGEALKQAIGTAQLARTDIELIAREHQICPYQLSLDLLPWMDVVICDQHYLYSLSGLLPGFMEQQGRRWSVLVDEAHNLPGRARRMYSASLSKAVLMKLKRGAPSGLRKALDKINRALLELQKGDWTEPDYCSEEALPEKLLRSLEEFAAAVTEQALREPTLLVRTPALGDFYYECLQFLRVAEHWGEDYRFEMIRGRGRQGLSVALNCLDPARLLAQRQQLLHSVTVFSATLSPPEWSLQVLGLSADAVVRRQGSPFAPGQLQVQIATDVDTRYGHRQDSLPALASRILHWLGQHSGNCIVYFPSYRYLQDCLALLQDLGLEGLSGQIWVQERDTRPDQRDQLLALLERERDVTAFCILGGVFGEGIDLPGGRLSSVVVVGVGLPQHNRETQLLRHYFQQRYGRGFEYAYLYPGMQKVDQALGRVVRTPEDKGTALLIDSRYQQSDYRQLLPPWWEYSLGGS